MNYATKAVIFILLIGAEARAAPAKRIAQPLRNAFVSRISEYTAMPDLPTIQPKPSTIQVSVPPYIVANKFISRRGRYFHSCGFGIIGPDHFAPRVTKFSTEPIMVLVGAYLKCRMIHAALIEPGVSLASYPPGYFGAHEYEGLLVSDWIEFSDESSLSQLFALLTEVTREPEEDWESYFFFSDNPNAKLAEYRNETQFKPELLFELVGETTVRVEINLTKERVLIHENEKWDGYQLDKWSAAALMKIVIEERKKLREGFVTNPTSS